eukprot:403357847
MNLNQMNQNLQSSSSYNHLQEREYMSNISESFQRAEEETRKAEQMLAKWRRDHSQTSQNIEVRESKDSHSRDKEQSNRNQFKQSRNQESQRISNQQQQTQRSQERNSFDNRENYLQNNFEYNQGREQTQNHQILEEVQSRQKRPSSGMFHNQMLQQNLKPNLEDYGSLQSQDTFDQKDQQRNRQLHPQILNSTSQYGSFENNQKQYRPTDAYDNNYSTVNSNNKQQPLSILKHQTLQDHSDYESRLLDNDENDNSLNIIKPYPIQITEQYQKLNPVMHSISLHTNNANNQSIISQNQNISKHQHSFAVNESILTQGFGLTRTPTNQSQILQNPINLHRENNQLQNHLNSINNTLINVEQESEIIKLDKYYKQLLKSEKDEFEKRLQKVQHQAQRDAKKKLKNQINEMKQKLESHEQEDQLKLVQKKLDDLWERQNLEKENAKLMTKFEIESESRKTINEMTMKIIELEKQLRDKDLEVGSLKVQLDSAKGELQHEMSFNKYINKSQDNVIECENQILKQQNKQIQDHVLKLEKENSDKQTKLNNLLINEKQIGEKYESLKRKFALIVKEKENLEANKFQETAQFKDLASKEVLGCKNCEKWRIQMQDLSERYFAMIKNMRRELEQLHVETRSQIHNSQREIHHTLIGKLRDYLEVIKHRPAEQNVANLKQKTTPKPVAGQRKSSVVVLSKRKQSLLQNTNPNDTLDENRQQNMSVSISQGNLTDRQNTYPSRRYLYTIDNPYTLAGKQDQNRSYLLSTKLDQIQNSLMHKTIVKSTQRTKRASQTIQDEISQFIPNYRLTKKHQDQQSINAKKSKKNKRSKSVQGKRKNETIDGDKSKGTFTKKKKSTTIEINITNPVVENPKRQGVLGQNPNVVIQPVNPLETNDINSPKSILEDDQQVYSTNDKFAQKQKQNMLQNPQKQMTDVENNNQTAYFINDEGVGNSTTVKIQPQIEQHSYTHHNSFMPDTYAQTNYNSKGSSGQQNNYQTHHPNIYPIAGINTNLNFNIPHLHHSKTTINDNKKLKLNNILISDMENSADDNITTFNKHSGNNSRLKEDANFIVDNDDENDNQLPSKKQRMQRDILVQQTMQNNNNLQYQNSSRYQTDDINATTGALPSDRGILLQDYLEKNEVSDQQQYTSTNQYNTNSNYQTQDQLEESGKTKKKRGNSKQQPRQANAQINGHNHSVSSSLTGGNQQTNQANPASTINVNQNSTVSQSQMLLLNVEGLTNNTKNLSISQNQIDGFEISQGSVSNRQGGSRSRQIKRRRDQFGTRIQKGNKRHKVSFIDQIHKQPLREVFIVENYKKYYKNAQNEDDETNCNCCLF